MDPPARPAEVGSLLRLPDRGLHMRSWKLAGYSRLQYADVLPLFQMIAKNVGIRRARGRFVLATNIDIIFSNELVEFIAAGRIEPGYLYRVNRHDIEAAVPTDACLDDRMVFCSEHQLRVHLQSGSYAVDSRGQVVALPEDIVDGRTVRLGAGWHVREGTGPTGFFRWATARAQVHVDLSEPGWSKGAVLEFEVEPNPHEPASALDFDVLDDSETIAHFRIARRRVCRLDVPAGTLRRTFEIRSTAPANTRQRLAVFERRAALHYLVTSIALKSLDHRRETEDFIYPMDGWRMMPHAVVAAPHGGGAVSVVRRRRNGARLLRSAARRRQECIGSSSRASPEGDVAFGALGRSSNVAAIIGRAREDGTRRYPDAIGEAHVR